jgi:hypothetical protein
MKTSNFPAFVTMPSFDAIRLTGGSHVQGRDLSLGAVQSTWASRWKNAIPKLSAVAGSRWQFLIVHYACSFAVVSCEACPSGALL